MHSNSESELGQSAVCIALIWQMESTKLIVLSK